VQIFARGCLFFVSQGVLDGKEVLTPGLENGGSQNAGWPETKMVSPWPWYKPFYLNRQVKGLHGY